MKKLIVVLAIGAMFLATGFGGGQSAALAASGKTLNFGIISYLTGPASPWGIPNYRSISMGAWKVNDQGGFKVKGRPTIGNLLYMTPSTSLPRRSRRLIRQSMVIR